MFEIFLKNSFILFINCVSIKLNITKNYVFANKFLQWDQLFKIKFVDPSALALRNCVSFTIKKKTFNIKDVSTLSVIM